MVVTPETKTDRVGEGQAVRAVKSWIAWRLRDLADLVDRSTGPRAFPGYWNRTPRGTKVTVTEGIQIQPVVPGCPLWFMAEDYDRAWQGQP